MWSEYQERRYRAERNLETFYLELVRETDGAVLVTDGVEQVWLPKSFIVMTHKKDKYYEIDVPVWLARKNGLL